MIKLKDYLLDTNTCMVKQSSIINELRNFAIFFSFRLQRHNVQVVSIKNTNLIQTLRFRSLDPVG